MTETQKRGRGRPRKYPMKGSGACMGKPAGEECSTTVNPLYNEQSLAGTKALRQTIASANRSQALLASDAKKAVQAEKRAVLQSARELRQSQRATESAMRAQEREARQMQAKLERAEKKAFADEYMNQLDALQKQTYKDDVSKIYKILIQAREQANVIIEKEDKLKLLQASKFAVENKYRLEKLSHLYKVREYIDANYQFGKPLPGLPVVREESPSDMNEAELLRELDEEMKKGGKSKSKSKSKTTQRKKTSTTKSKSKK